MEKRAERWNDWKWQFSHRITTSGQLKGVIPLDEAERGDIDKCLEHFRMAITPYYASLTERPDPHAGHPHRG